MTDRIDEEGLRDRLKAVVSNSVRDAKDRALYGLGSNTAKGRLDISAGTKHLFKSWREYVGRESAAGNKKVAQSPTLADLHDFLSSTMGIDVGTDKLAQIASMHDNDNAEEPAHQQLEPQDPQPAQPASQEPQPNDAANDANDPDSLGPMYPNQGRAKKTPPKTAPSGSAQAGLDRFSKFRQPEKPNFQKQPAAPGPARSTFGQRGAGSATAPAAGGKSFGKRGTAPAANDAAPSADSRARSVLSKMKATSPAEYNALRSKFAKGGGAPQQAPKQDDLTARKAALRAQMNRAANESVIVEATDPNQVTFDPRTLFPKVANVLIKQGLMKVNRRDGVSSEGGQGGSGSDDAGATNGNRRAEINGDGHAVDAEKMKRILEKGGIDGKRMAAIKQAAENGSLPREVFNPLSLQTMVCIVDAVLSSIEKTNAPGQMAAVQTTSTGTTIDFNAFEKRLAEKKISGESITKLRQTLSSQGEGALEKMIAGSAATGSDPKLKTLILNIVLATVEAMSVAKKQPQQTK